MSTCEQCRRDFDACAREHRHPDFPDYESCQRDFSACVAPALREACEMPAVAPPRFNPQAPPPQGSAVIIEH